VLSQNKYRAIYDKFGEYVFKEGYLQPDGTKVGGYVFTYDPKIYFSEFFGRSDPWNDQFDLEGTD